VDEGIHGITHWVAFDDSQIKSTLDPEITDWQRQHIQDIASEHHKSVGPLIGEEPSPKQATRVGDPSDYIDRIEQLAAMGKTLDDLDQNAMKEIGWDRGKKGLLNAVNKDMRLADPEFVNYKNYSDVPIDQAVAAMRKRLGDVMPESEPPAAFGFPPGFIDSFETQPNLYDVYNEGYMTHVKPILGQFEKNMTGPEANHKVGMVADNLSVAHKQALDAYLEKVYGQLVDNKFAATRSGELARDMSLLNYTRRRGFDNFLQIALPYHFWYGRSMMNWITTAPDKPAYFANYARIRAMQQHAIRQPGFPERLEGKMQITLPFLPEDYNTLFFDPMHQLFPIEQILDPIFQMLEMPTQLSRKTEYVLQRMVAQEQITTNQYKQAINDPESEIYLKAQQQAQMEMDDGVSNPMDFVQSMWGMSLPLNIAYNKYKKDVMGKDNVYNNLLPATRLIQSMTSWVTPGGITGPEGFVREALGGNARGYLWDFYVNREITNMVIQGELELDDALLAQVEKQGPAWEAAMDRVGKIQSLKMLAASFWVDVFPEGEMGARDLQAEFAQAIENNKTAEFFDEHPEYEARLQMSNWDNPEAQMKNYIKSQIWDKYFEMSDLDQKRVKEVLGEDFETYFINKETRSYDSIPIETMLGWAQQLEGEIPENAPRFKSGEEFELSPEAQAQAYETYYTARKSQFPNISSIEALYYSSDDPEAKNKVEKLFPQLREYKNWQAQYFAENKDVVPLIKREDSWIMGIPEPARESVLDYQGMRAQLFPNLGELWDEYFSYPEKSKERRQMWEDHPELQASIDFKHQYMAWRNETIPYLSDIDDITEGVLGKDWQTKYNVPYNLEDKMTNQAKQALEASRLTGELTPGLRNELHMHWQEMGEPFDNFEVWLSCMRGLGVVK
jgi:hypothetical protein